MSPTETLTRRVLTARKRYIEELGELLSEFSDPLQRERISTRAVQALVADMTEEAARNGEATCKLWERVWRELYEAGADDLNYRSEVGTLLRLALHYIDRMRDTCRDMAAHGYPVSADADLDAVRAKVCDRLVETEMPWPPAEPEIEPEEMARAREAIARGETVDIREVIRELQG
ncbi:MAG: hypothetical protein L0Z62_19660 [Gemmataceae bacterium]|nr:hypothetical protein [Gemmataceae bacterium]